MSVLLRDEARPSIPLSDDRGERVKPRLPLVPVNELVETFIETLDVLDEDGIAFHISLGCDRWTAVDANRDLVESLLLGLSLRARDRMRQGGLLSLATSLKELGESSLEETSLPPGEYVRISVVDTGGWTEGVERTWTARVESSQRLERPSAAALRQMAEEGGGALVCTRGTGCGERADLYLPALRRRIRSVLDLT